MDPDETHDDFNYEEAPDMERDVRIDHDAEVYVVRTDPGGGVSSYGFDHVLDRIERLTYAFGTTEVPKVARGSMEAWDTLANLQDRAKRDYERTGERCVADLSPQLTGLEGWRVEVVDHDGDEPRRFIVGRSTGWIPCHLEISRRNAHGGGPARLEYHSVREIEQVR